MISYLNFLIEANICLLILGGFYFLILNKERHFTWKRCYILSIALLCLTVPFLQLGNPFDTQLQIPIVSGLQAIILPEVVVVANSTANKMVMEGSSGTPIIPYLYFAGILVFATILLYQLTQVIRLYYLRKSQVSKEDGKVLIPTHGQLPTFSFFNLLFYDNTLDLTEEEQEKIIQHEYAHIKQWHSLDILFLELVKVIFWMNPVIWMLRRSIQDIHEFLADESILKTSNTTQYSSLLAKMAVKQMTLPLGHHFNKSLILKRIEIMKSPRKKPMLWKWLSSLPIIALIVFVFSCNEELTEDVSEVMKTASQSEIPAHLQDDVAKLKLKHPDAEFVYIRVDKESLDHLETIKEMADPSSIGMINVLKEEEVVELIVNKKGPLEKFAQMNSDGETFQIVDKSAMPEGGFGEYYQHIASNMRYPVQAKKLGVEGKVYVQFVIDKEGRVTNVKVVKGIGAGCDAEAARVVALPYNWSVPEHKGRPVNQQLIMPVTFSLTGKPIANVTN